MTTDVLARQQATSLHTYLHKPADYGVLLIVVGCNVSVLGAANAKGTRAMDWTILLLSLGHVPFVILSCTAPNWSSFAMELSLSSRWIPSLFLSLAVCIQLGDSLGCGVLHFVYP